MGKTHIVKQGEHLSSIAAEHGFAHFRTIWEHPRNAALRQKRENPHVLFPGDEVFIPDREEKVVQVPAGRTHTFQIAEELLLLRLRVRDFNNEPLKQNTFCLLTVGPLGSGRRLFPNEKGIIEDELERRIRLGELVIPSKNIKMDLKIGSLDPPDTLSGQRARLNNLGYCAGFADFELKQFTWAVEEFKCDQKMVPVAEKIDFIHGIQTKAVQQRLKDVHGS